MGTFENLLLFLPSIIFSIEMIVMKVVFSSGVDPTSVSVFRALLGAVVLGAYLRKFEKIVKNWKFFLLFGGVAILSDLLFFLGQSRTQPGIAGLVFRSSALFSVILGILLFREKLTKGQITGGILMIFGLLLLTDLSEMGEFSSGYFLVLGSAVLISISNVLNKIGFDRGLSALEITFGRFLFGGVSLFAGLAFFGGVSFPATLSDLGGVVYATASGIAVISLIAYVIGRFGVSNFSLSFVSSAVFTAGLSFVFLGERLSQIQLLGGAILLAGAIAVTVFKKDATRSRKRA